MASYAEGFCAETPLLFEPGTRWNYADAHTVAARVVEVVAGVPFDKYLQDNIFAPLGMDGQCAGLLCRTHSKHRA